MENWTIQIPQTGTTIPVQFAHSLAMKFIHIRRHPERAVQDWAFAASVLDEALVAHVVLPTEDSVASIPMYYVRVGQRLYLHGAIANGLLRKLIAAGHATLSVALVDGLVVASSASFHSLNYRSVMLRGVCRLVDDPIEKESCLWASIEKMVQGRSRDLPALTEQDLNSTLVACIEITELAVKQRKGPPGDTNGAWAGVVPTFTSYAKPVAADPRAPLPAYIAAKLGAGH